MFQYLNERIWNLVDLKIYVVRTKRNRKENQQIVLYYSVYLN